MPSPDIYINHFTALVGPVNIKRWDSSKDGATMLFLKEWEWHENNGENENYIYFFKEKYFNLVEEFSLNNFIDI